MKRILISALFILVATVSLVVLARESPPSDVPSTASVPTSDYSTTPSTPTNDMNADTSNPSSGSGGSTASQPTSDTSGSNESAQSSDLPHTAGPLPLVALIGSLSIAAGLGLKAISRQGLS